MLRPSLDVLGPRGLIQSKPWLLGGDILALTLHAPAEGHQIAPKVHECSSGYGTSQRLGNAPYPDVGVGRTVEGKVLRQRIDEHESVVHVTANDRLLGARLRQP